MDDDETAFFSRNRTSFVASVTALNRTASDKAYISFGATDDESDSTQDDRSEDQSSPKKRVKYDVTHEGRKIPPAAGRDGETSGIPITLSSDEEEESTESNKRGNKDVMATKRDKSCRNRESRSPSRDGSLTPPPQLSPRRRLAGTQLIQNTFKGIRHERARSPKLLPLDAAEIEFENQMRQKLSDEIDFDILKGVVPDNTTELLHVNTAVVTSKDIPDNVIEIVVRGIFIDLPETVRIISDIKSWETPRILRMRLNMKLSVAKIGFCKEAGFSTVVSGQKIVDKGNERKMNEILLAYRGIRVFDYVTLHGLGISAGEQPYFEAYTKESWTCLAQNPELRRTQQISASKVASTHSDSLETMQQGENANTTDKHIKITLRAKDGRELKVRTLPSTKISAIIAGFRKTHHITQEVQLCLEGEVLEGTVGDSDVESDDVIDVRILG